LKFLTIVILLIYRILTLFETIVCNKILFKFKDKKKQTLVFIFFLHIDNIN